MNEDALIQWLRRRRGTRGLGDDGAILPAGAEWTVTMDSQIQGVHFLADIDQKIIARRLLRVNLSDLAAMGAVPAFAFLSLSGPSRWDRKTFLHALTRECDRYGVELAGGDLSSQEIISTTMTLIGKSAAGGRWLRRDLARPGDRLWLGGVVGESALGCRLVAGGARLEGRRVVWKEDSPLRAALESSSESIRRAARSAVRRHLLPEPQLELGRGLALMERCAAIDVSDGLAKDLTRLCRESGVGAEIYEERLPLSKGFSQMEKLSPELQIDPLRGGEDYVLLFALPADLEPPVSCREIGRITTSEDVLIHRQGRAVPLSPEGWDHLSEDRRSGNRES